jgi:hypothetical protein
MLAAVKTANPAFGALIGKVVLHYFFKGLGGRVAQHFIVEPDQQVLGVYGMRHGSYLLPSFRVVSFML